MTIQLKTKFLPNDSTKSGKVKAFIEIPCKCGEILIRAWKEEAPRIYYCSNCKARFDIVKVNENDKRKTQRKAS